MCLEWSRIGPCLGLPLRPRPLEGWVVLTSLSMCERKVNWITIENARTAVSFITSDWRPRALSSDSEKWSLQGHTCCVRAGMSVIGAHGASGAHTGASPSRSQFSLLSAESGLNPGRSRPYTPGSTPAVVVTLTDSPLLKWGLDARDAHRNSSQYCHCPQDRRGPSDRRPREVARGGAQHRHAVAAHQSRVRVECKRISMNVYVTPLMCTWFFSLCVHTCVPVRKLRVIKANNVLIDVNSCVFIHTSVCVCVYLCIWKKENKSPIRRVMGHPSVGQGNPSWPCVPLCGAVLLLS